MKLPAPSSVLALLNNRRRPQDASQGTAAGAKLKTNSVPSTRREHIFL